MTTPSSSIQIRPTQPATSAGGKYKLQALWFALFFVLASGLSSQAAKATKWTGGTSTSWTATGNWDNGVPTTGAGDTVTIGAGTFQPTLPSSAVSLATVTILSGATLTGGGTGSTLTTTGDLTIDSGGNLVMGTRTLTVQGTLYVNGTVTTTGSSSSAVNLSVGSTGSFLAAALKVTGTYGNLGTANMGTSTITLGGTTAQSISGFVNNLTVNVGTGGSVSQGGDVTIGGNLVLTAGTYSANAYKTSIAGNITGTGSLFSSGTGTVTFNSSTGASQTSVIGTYYVLEVNGTGNTVTVQNNITVNSDIKVTAGTLALGSGGTSRTVTKGTPGGAISVGASGKIIIVSTGTTPWASVFLTGWAAPSLTAGSTIELGGSSTSSTTLDITSFQNLNINRTGSGATVSLPSSGITVLGNVTVTSGTLAVGNYNMSVTGNVRVESGKALTSGTGTITVSGNWINNGTFTPGGGIVSFTGATTHTVATGSSATTFNTLTIATTPGCKLDLGGLNQTAARLNFGSVIQLAGVWGSSGAPGVTYADDIRFLNTSAGIITVIKGPPVTMSVTLVSGDNPSNYGSVSETPRTIRILVTPSTSPAGPQPVGGSLLEIRDNVAANVIGSIQLPPTAPFTVDFTIPSTTAIAAGNRNIQAVYPADANYNMSTGTLAQVVYRCPVQWSDASTQAYDGTTKANASSLVVANNLDGLNLNLTAGTAGTLDSKNVGLRPVSLGVPVRVNSATNSTGTGAAASITVTVAPAVDGNTLIAVIATRSTTPHAVQSIVQPGATWSRVVDSLGTAGTTTEIWYAPNVYGAGKTVTINLSPSAYAAAVVTEYSGLLVPTSVDQTAYNNGSGTAATTGTTAPTSQDNELWIAGFGLASSSSTYNLGSISTGFYTVASPSSTSSSSGNNARVYALEKVSTAAGSAGPATCAATAGASVQWSGAMATFKAKQPSAPSWIPLAVNGTAATNYALSDNMGNLNVMPKLLTVTGLNAMPKIYNADTIVGVTGTPILGLAEAPGTGNALDGLPYIGDDVTPSIPTTGNLLSKDVGMGIGVNVLGLFFLGADGGNYSPVPPMLSADVTPKPLVVTGLSVVPKEYDGTLGALFFGMPGFAPPLTPGTGMNDDGRPYLGDDISVIGAPLGFYADKNAKLNIPVNVSGLALGGMQMGDYTLVPLTLLGDILPKSVTVTATADSKVYDGTSASGGTPSVGPLIGDDVAIATQRFDSQDAGPRTLLPALTVKAGDTDVSANYAMKAVTAIGTISPKPLTVVGLTAKSKIYNGNTVATLEGAASLLPPEAVGAGSQNDGLPYDVDAVSAGGSPVGAFASPNLGADKPVAVSGITIVGTGNGNYTPTPPTDLLASITLRTANFSRNPGTSMRIRFADILSQATDNAGIGLTYAGLVTPTSNGAKLAYSPPYVSYVPTSNTPDTFTYKVNPGGALGVVTITVLDPNSQIAKIVAFDPSHATIIFAGISGRYYKIQRTADLSGTPAWIDRATVLVPASGVFTYTDPAPPSGNLWYRAISQ